MLPVYVGAVVLVLGYLIAGSLTSNIDNRDLAALLDPFGGGAADRLTEYWTIAEKNSRLVPLAGVFLWNRVLWTGSSAPSLLALTYARFSFSSAPRLGGEGAQGPRAAAASRPRGTSPPPPFPGPRLLAARVLVRRRSRGSSRASSSERR